MKRIVSAFFILIMHCAMGQHGNEWIRFDQPYFKIPVAKEGLYRISHNDLALAGFDLSADPKTFQLFHRGVEQAILVAGQDDGILDQSDYIEFYGRGNDGTLDSSLYAQPHFQPHRLYNLYSDTTSYFLTYGTSAGKRMSFFSASPEGLETQSYHHAEKILILKAQYAAGRDYESGNVHLSTFDEGEGWMGAQILQNQEATYAIEGILHSSPASGKPAIELLLTGRGPMAHNVDVYAGSRLLSSISFSGYQSYKHTQEIEWSDIDSNGKLSLKVRVRGLAGADRVSVGYIRLTYPQQISMAGVAEQIFLLAEDGSSSRYVRIPDPSTAMRLFDITDVATPVQIGSVLTSTLDAVVPGPGRRRVLATGVVQSPGSIRRVTFRNFDPASFNYIIVTHPSLRKPALGYTDPIKAYGEYRALPEGGGFDTLVVNIDQLYDQFNYGEKSSRAIFQFLRFCASVKTPDYLFLVGKGLNVNYGYHRNPNAFPVYKDLVPTAGYPASDMAFTAGLAGETPAVATGRLTAIHPADVAAYLNKVKARDAMPFDDLTRKKILHLSGGIEEYEPVMFRNILAEYATVAEGPYIGAEVQALSKESTTVKFVNIADEVNRGLGLITFFGHSAPNTTDFDIGHVTDPVLGYDNKGKYPLMLMNGCDAGSYFLNTTIIGEDWIKAEDKGAVGFIAHSGYGLLSGLHRYSSTFYDVAFADSVFVAEGVGKVQQEVARRYIAEFGAAPNDVSQVQQMVLLGDPAVKLFPAGKPDYAVTGNEISAASFDGEPITAYADSFLIHIPVKNFGITGKEKIRIQLTRQSAGQPVLTYDSIINGVLYLDTISILIRNRDVNHSGINTFSVSVDADNIVEELNESNNAATFELFIPLNSTRNLYPYNFSIVKSRAADLSFQYTDVLGAPRTYLLEVDTAATFDSGYRKQFQIEATVLARRQVELLENDSLVYYWRTRIAEPLENESSEWSVSSFTYIRDGQEGWAQIQFPQFTGNAAHGLVKDPVLRRIHYEETSSDIAIRTFSSAAGKPIDSVSLRINGAEFNLLNQGAACRNNTINLVAFNRKSTQPYAGLYFTWYELLFQYGGRMLLCGREPYVINSFKPNELVTGNGNDIIRYVDNIAEGDSVILFNIGDAGFLQWPPEAKSKLAELGISPAQLEELQNGDAVVIFGRKGAASGAANFTKAPSPTSALQVEKTITGRFSSGTLSSVVIGPATRWQHLDVGYNEVEAVDDAAFSLVGIRADGGHDTLKTDIRSDFDLSFIDAQLYPHLSVVFHTEDDINLTSPQLKQWLVLYEPVAEGIVFYHGSTDRQVLNEGERYSGDFGFINVSDKEFPDSLTVRYALSNRADAGASAAMMKINAPLPGDTTMFSINLNTEGKAGLHDVEVFVNPRLLTERSFDNNVVILGGHVEVLTDNRRPVIDVTIDGRHIENEENVSASPEIIVRVWDENPFILKRDTVDINLYLAFPCAEEDCGFERISFSRDDITWEPATATSGFLVRFSPLRLAEGTYTLRVEATDANGNAAASEPFELSFTVDYDPFIAVASPYPNPFSDEITFELSVSGAEASTGFVHLEITTLNGTKVAEFTRNGLHVGVNRIRWDGRRSGHRLPDGIYVYRLVVGGVGTQQTQRGKIIIVK